MTGFRIVSIPIVFVVTFGLTYFGLSLLTGSLLTDRTLPALAGLVGFVVAGLLWFQYWRKVYFAVAGIAFVIFTVLAVRVIYRIVIRPPWIAIYYQMKNQARFPVEEGAYRAEEECKKAAFERLKDYEIVIEGRPVDTYTCAKNCGLSAIFGALTLADYRCEVGIFPGVK